MNNNGVCFLIVRFSTLDKNFVLMGNDFLDYIDNHERKSIPLDYFEKKGYLIELSYRPRLDYLKVIDKIEGGYNGK